MGVATFIVGLLPNYATIGFAAPAILIGLRLLQGLALGGEYGGAAIYVAEHAPHAKRGSYTAWIQTTATLGLFLSLLVILTCRLSMDKESFESWGWRVPFLLSIVLLGISVWIRLKLNESPLFQKMKEEGTLSKAPLTESFGEWRNLRIVLIALIGLTAGQAVVWYTGQFYALFFLTQVLKVEGQTANILIGVALLLGVPFFVIFGALSDRIGRKPIIMAGCLLAALTYFPLFSALTYFANPALQEAQRVSPVVAVADVRECSFQFNPVGTAAFTSSCDVAKSALARRGIPYSNRRAEAGATAYIAVGDIHVASFDATGDEDGSARAAFDAALSDALAQAGQYSASADPAAINTPMVVLVLFVLVLYVTMVYGPIAAMLVELFPTRIRYTSLSLPYHIGNGWFGGFLPTVAFAIVAASGNIYSGLWYPVIIAAITFVVGMIFVPETKDRSIHF